MNHWNAAQLQEFTAGSWNNLVLPGETAMRYSKEIDRYTRVLWLSRREPRANGVVGEGLDMCVQVDLTPNGTDGTAWQDLRKWQAEVAPVLLRLSGHDVLAGVEQFRLVQSDSYVFRDPVQKLRVMLNDKVVHQLLTHDFLPQIDWYRFLAGARQEGTELVCEWGKCKRVVADLRARLSRDMDHNSRGPSVRSNYESRTPRSYG